MMIEMNGVPRIELKLFLAAFDDQQNVRYTCTLHKCLHAHCIDKRLLVQRDVTASTKDPSSPSLWSTREVAMGVHLVGER